MQTRGDLPTLAAPLAPPCISHEADNAKFHRSIRVNPHPAVAQSSILQMAKIVPSQTAAPSRNNPTRCETWALARPSLFDPRLIARQCGNTPQSHFFDNPDDRSFGCVGDANAPRLPKRRENVLIFSHEILNLNALYFEKTFS
ncbi:MAG: hypothetical protein Q9P14_16765 [candidate division KSB1 bacterium]|nr:hypothetical protein [candidate division KSB1 bacterium]